MSSNNIFDMHQHPSVTCNVVYLSWPFTIPPSISLIWNEHIRAGLQYQFCSFFKIVQKVVDPPPSFWTCKLQIVYVLTGPIIPIFWPCLVWKRVSFWMWSLGDSQQPFSCVFSHFRHGDTQAMTSSIFLLRVGFDWKDWVSDRVWLKRLGFGSGLGIV